MNDDASDRLSGEHSFEPLVDRLERQRVVDRRNSLDLAGHVSIYGGPDFVNPIVRDRLTAGANRAVIAGPIDAPSPRSRGRWPFKPWH